MIGITIEHAQIIDWTQTRGGYPIIQKENAEPAMPIIGFTDEGGRVSWDEWISAFEHGEWVFIYQDRTPEGELSRSWKIVPRFAEESSWTHEVKTAQAC